MTRFSTHESTIAWAGWAKASDAMSFPSKLIRTNQDIACVWPCWAGIRLEQVLRSTQLPGRGIHTINFACGAPAVTLPSTRFCCAERRHADAHSVPSNLDSTLVHSRGESLPAIRWRQR